MENKKQKFEGFSSPNNTQVPDELFDDLMADLSGAELKTVLYIIRRTFGFKKQSDNISISQMLNGITKKNGEVLDRGTGLAKGTLCRALKSLSEKNILIPERRFDDKGGNLSTEYRLNIANQKSDPENTLGSKKRQAPLGSKTGQGLVEKEDKPLVQKRDTQQTVIQQTVFKTVNVNATDNKKIQNLPNLPEQESKADYLAGDMVDQLKDQHSLNFYRLVARKIPETVIRQFLSEIKSDGAKNPARLFTYKINKYASEKLSQTKSHDLLEQKKNLFKSFKNPSDIDTS